MSMSFDEGWSILQKEAIDKLIHNLELGHSGHKLFTPEEYTRLYTVVYELTTEEPDKLYGLYQKTFEDYISSKILPRLRCNENDNNLLRELSRGWSNHKIMTKWLSGFFQYLPRGSRPLPPLEQTNHLIFYDRVCLQITDQVNRAIASLVDREREGEEIDRAMLKQVVDIFDEIGEAASSHFASKDLFPASCSHILHWAYANEANMSEIECFFRDEEYRVLQSILRLRHKNKILKILQVLRDIHGRVCDAISSYEKNLGEPIVVDRQAMFKQVENILEEIRDEALKVQSKDIEEALLEATARFYSNKALDWIATKSYEDYMLKVEECLEKEESGVSDYLRLTKKRKLIEVVQHELLNVHADKLEKKKMFSRFKKSRL